MDTSQKNICKLLINIRKDVQCIIREMQIKITKSTTMYQPKGLKLKILISPSIGKYVEQLELSYIVGWEYKMIKQILESCSELSLKVIHKFTI